MPDLVLVLVFVVVVFFGSCSWGRSRECREEEEGKMEWKKE
jgi:hypothetical protein